MLLKEFYKYIILAITSATGKMKHDLIRLCKISMRFPEGALIQLSLQKWAAGLLWGFS